MFDCVRGANSENGARDADFIQSLERGLAVIRAFGAEHPKLSLSEVAARTGLSRAAARRFLHTLVNLGYMRMEGSQFSLRPKILELGYAYLSSLSLPEVAMPHLEQLVEQVRESSSVSQLDGDDVVYIARVPTRRIMTVAISVGTRFPAYATSMGRVLLADRPDDWLDGYLASVTLVPLTSHTVADPVRAAGRAGHDPGAGLGPGRPGAGRGPAVGGRPDPGRRRPGHRRGQRVHPRRAAHRGRGRRRPAGAAAAHGPGHRDRPAPGRGGGPWVGRRGGPWRWPAAWGGGWGGGRARRGGCRNHGRACHTGAVQTLVIDHPLVTHKLTALRDVSTETATFRRLADELVTLLAYEATREVRVQPVTVRTPLGDAAGVKIGNPPPLIVPVLRAGIGMLDGMIRLLPMADVGFVGLVRDEESLVASTYADRIPADLTGREAFVLDPMLATGARCRP